MVYIYVLKLEYNKFYVGKTVSPINRVNNHFDVKGSAWTRKFKPVDIIEIIPNCDELDEDKYTLKYMKEKGIQNVRGGTFCNINLSKSDVITIRKMIDFSSDKCYICSKPGHFAKNCTEEYDQMLDIIFTNMIENDFGQNELSTSTQIINQNLIPENKINIIKDEPKEKKICARCGRFGHLVEMCYSKTTLDGKPISDSHKVKSFKKDKNSIINTQNQISTSTQTLVQTPAKSQSKSDNKYPCEYCAKEFDTLNGKNYHIRFHCKSKPKKSTNNSTVPINQNNIDSQDNSQTTQTSQEFNTDQIIDINSTMEEQLIKSKYEPKIIIEDNIVKPKQLENKHIIKELDNKNMQCDCIGSIFSPHTISKCKMKNVFNFF